MWCTRKQVEWTGTIYNHKREYTCLNCGMKYACKKSELDEAVPLQVQREIMEELEDGD